MTRKNFLIYLLIVGVFASLICLILIKGKNLHQPTVQFPHSTTQTTNDQSLLKLTNETPEVPSDSTISLLTHPFIILVLQIIVILIISRLFGMLAKRIGQSAVIGEIIAGIVLGPSLFGMVLPQAAHFLFPAESLKILQQLSQVGIAFFMFVIGTELDTTVLKKKTQDAVIVSHASIIFPYFLGMTLSYFIYEKYAPAGINFLSFSLFMGITMSITAFPVLARILKERKLTKTSLGILALTCAAADDITAWCILPFVIVIAKSQNMNQAIMTLVFALAFVLVMLYTVKPMLAKAHSRYFNNEKGNKRFVLPVLLILAASAYTSEAIGIHLLFGAFLAGVLMPRSFNFNNTIAEKIQRLIILLFLPVFFVLTGLRTHISLVNDAPLWVLCLTVIALAILGKFGGSALAARLTGHTWHDSLSLGALMNTRGLMELIILNIGYDLHILTPQIFSIMVLMTIITTFMTGPCLKIINYIFVK